MINCPTRLSTADVCYARGTVRYLHGERELSLCAYERKDEKRVCVYLPRALGTVNVALLIYNEALDRELLRLPLCWTDFEQGRDRYLTPPLSLGRGLYFFKIELQSPIGKLYGYRDGDSIAFAYEADPTFQLSVSDFIHPAPVAHYGGIIYHIFVDRYRRSSRVIAKDGTYILDYSQGIPEYPEYPGAPLKNNSFYGGSLWGIIDALPHLCELGVSMLYLSPIFESPSNHKYDTSDYMTVDEAFGGEEALRALLAEAGKMGISIILDGVFNHTGADSLYFNKYGRYPSVGAYQSKESPYYPWFEFQCYPDKYTCWWDIDILPRIRSDLGCVQDYFVKRGGVIDKYAKMGIAGMRLDVADELPDAFIAKIKRALLRESPDSILYGEVWEDASNKIAYDKRKEYFLGDELDGVMNYPVREGIIDFLTRKGTEKLSYALLELIEHTPERILHAQMNLLGTHDTPRILTVLADEPCEGLSNRELRDKRIAREDYDKAVARLKIAYTVIATLPGIPSVYYGDDAGLEGYGDPFNRMPYPWDDIQQDIHNHYKKIGQIRRSQSVYRDGDFKLLYLDRDALIFERRTEKYSYITAVNLSDRPMRIESSGKLLLDCQKRRSDLTLAPFSAEIFRISVFDSLAFYYL